MHTLDKNHFYIGSLGKEAFGTAGLIESHISRVMSFLGERNSRRISTQKHKWVKNDLRALCGEQDVSNPYEFIGFSNMMLKIHMSFYGC